jgi:hypothetical protein
MTSMFAMGRKDDDWEVEADSCNDSHIWNPEQQKDTIKVCRDHHVHGDPQY